MRTQGTEHQHSRYRFELLQSGGKSVGIPKLLIWPPNAADYEDHCWKPPPGGALASGNVGGIVETFMELRLCGSVVVEISVSHEPARGGGRS